MAIFAGEKTELGRATTSLLQEIPKAIHSFEYDLRKRRYFLGMEWKQQPDSRSEIPTPQNEGGAALSNATEPKLELICSIEVENVTEEESIEEQQALRVMDHFLLHVFLALNIVIPGCCNFHGLYGDLWGGIWDSPDNSQTTGRMAEVVRWPPVTCLPLEASSEWIRKLKLGVRQVASSPTERAIFSLLNFSADGDVKPTNLLWIAHSLEALYRTPHTAIYETLRDRAFLTLGRPDDAVAWKRRLKAFYDMRSSFVHGRKDIAIPRYSHDFEDEITHHELELITTWEPALALAVSTLQLLVIQKWERLDFETITRGVALE